MRRPGKPCQRPAPRIRFTVSRQKDLLCFSSDSQPARRTPVRQRGIAGDGKGHRAPPNPPPVTGGFGPGTREGIEQAAPGESGLKKTGPGQGNNWQERLRTGQPADSYQSPLSVVREEERGEHRALEIKLRRTVSPRDADEEACFEEILRAAWVLQRLRLAEATLRAGCAALSVQQISSVAGRICSIRAHYRGVLQAANRRLLELRRGRVRRMKESEEAGSDLFDPFLPPPI
jgi:hypothetical protein